MVEPENLVLTILQTIQSAMSKMENDIVGIKQHLNIIEMRTQNIESGINVIEQRTNYIEKGLENIVKRLDTMV
jgi:archaellum component FlaC